MTGGTPSELADAYLDALESRADDDELEAARERLDALRERLERFERDYGESDPVTEELREKVQAAQDEVAELEDQRRGTEELEAELLESAGGFALDDEWLRPEVIEALNRALTGSARPTLRVEDVELSGPEDADELEEVLRYDIIDIVRKIALDGLGESAALEQTWRSIEDTTKEGAFRVVAEAGAADPDDVVECIDQDIERDTARNRLKNAVYLDISPYHREDGTYRLSTAGCYMAAEYAGSAPTGDGDAERETNEADADDGQTTLVDGAAAADGGDPDE
jgi:hypothetical protein